MHQSRRRVHKELSKIEKKLVAFSSLLFEDSSQHSQAAQESENAELDTRSACAELCNTAREVLRRSCDFLYGTHLPENASCFESVHTEFSPDGQLLVFLPPPPSRLMYEEKYLQHDSHQEDEEALRADLARRCVFWSLHSFCCLHVCERDGVSNRVSMGR